MSLPRPGHAEQDPDLWWQAAQAALEELGAERRRRHRPLRARCTGSSCSTTDAAPLRPAILWNDQRTAAECAEIEATVGLERLIALTGNRALTGFTAPKLLWVRAPRAGHLRRIAHVLLPKDYVRLRLTGELATDVSDASGTLLFDVARPTWSEEVLERSSSPRVVSARARVGPPSPARRRRAARRCRRRRPGGRARSASASTGPAPSSVALGTSGVVFGVLPALAADPRGGVHTFCHAVPGTWHAMGVMLSAAGSLDWLHDSVARRAPSSRRSSRRPQPGRRARGPPVRPVPDRRADAARRPRRPRRVRGPRGCGTTAARSPGPCSRASPMAFATRSSCCAALGLRPSVGRMGGGAAAICGCGSWRRLSTCRSSSPRPRGAALRRSDPRRRRRRRLRRRLAAVAPCVRVVGRVDPEPAWRDAYAGGYAAFRRLYPAIASLRAAGA